MASGGRRVKLLARGGGVPRTAPAACRTTDASCRFHAAPPFLAPTSAPPLAKRWRVRRNSSFPRLQSSGTRGRHDFDSTLGAVEPARRSRAPGTLVDRHAIALYRAVSTATKKRTTTSAVQPRSRGEDGKGACASHVHGQSMLATTVSGRRRPRPLRAVGRLRAGDRLPRVDSTRGFTNISPVRQPSRARSRRPRWRCSSLPRSV